MQIAVCLTISRQATIASYPLHFRVCQKLKTRAKTDNRDFGVISRIFTGLDSGTTQTAGKNLPIINAVPFRFPMRPKRHAG